MHNYMGANYSLISGATVASRKQYKYNNHDRKFKLIMFDFNLYLSAALFCWFRCEEKVPRWEVFWNVNALKQARCQVNPRLRGPAVDFCTLGRSLNLYSMDGTLRPTIMVQSTIYVKLFGGSWSTSSMIERPLLTAASTCLQLDTLLIIFRFIERVPVIRNLILQHVTME